MCKNLIIIGNGLFYNFFKEEITQEEYNKLFKKIILKYIKEIKGAKTIDEIIKYFKNKINDYKDWIKINDYFYSIDWDFKKDIESFCKSFLSNIIDILESFFNSGNNIYYEDILNEWNFEKNNKLIEEIYEKKYKLIFKNIKNKNNEQKEYIKGQIWKLGIYISEYIVNFSIIDINEKLINKELFKDSKNIMLLNSFKKNMLDSYLVTTNYYFYNEMFQESEINNYLHGKIFINSNFWLKNGQKELEEKGLNDCSNYTMNNELDENYSHLKENCLNVENVFIFGLSTIGEDRIVKTIKEIKNIRNIYFSYYGSIDDNNDWRKKFNDKPSINTVPIKLNNWSNKINKIIIDQNKNNINYE